MYVCMCTVFPQTEAMATNVSPCTNHGDNLRRHLQQLNDSNACMDCLENGDRATVKTNHPRDKMLWTLRCSLR